MASNEVDEIRAQRFAFLLAVYRAADGDTQEYVQWDPIAEKLGFDGRLAMKIVTYLREEHLLEEPMMGNVVLLTHWGLKEIEEALRSPDVPTEHFLPFTVTQNIVNVQTINGVHKALGRTSRRRCAQMTARSFATMTASPSCARLGCR